MVTYQMTFAWWVFIGWWWTPLSWMAALAGGALRAVGLLAAANPLCRSCRLLRLVNDKYRERFYLSNALK